MKLYYVRSTGREFHGFKDIILTWFMVGRKLPVAPYAELIADYAELDDDTRFRAEVRVNEMFTEDEARAVLAWLNEHRPAVHVIKELETTPVKASSEDGGELIGLIQVPLGGLQDCLVPNKKDWDLQCYYDLRFHERMEQSTVQEPR